MTLSLKVRAKRSAGSWEISCEETGDSVESESLEKGLTDLINLVGTSMEAETETPRRVIIALEDVKASATLAVRFENNRSLEEFSHASTEEDEKTPLLEGQQMCLPAGDVKEVPDICPLYDRKEFECTADPAACTLTDEERNDRGCFVPAPIRNVPRELPDGWHPSSNYCHQCIVLGLARDPGKKIPHNVCTEADLPPFGLKICPCGGPVLEVPCPDWGEDTLCHREADPEAEICERYATPYTPCNDAKSRHCPLGDKRALERFRRQQGRNPESGAITVNYCRSKGCPDLKPRENTGPYADQTPIKYECSRTGTLPGGKMICPDPLEATP